MRENYHKIEDFLMDESFISWINGENTADTSEWNVWLQQDPSNARVVDEAKLFLNAIQIKEKPVDKTKLEIAEARLRNAIKLENRPAKVIGLGKRVKWYWAAAVFIIILSVGLFNRYSQPQKIELASNYGEVQKNKLPDGTEVILNANSKVRLQKNWKKGEDREVWIEGEAFFHVKKTPNHDKFIVHTDAFDIIVTGTSFNVVNEDGKSSVILKEGSVNILRENEETITMKPGDFVEFSNEHLQQKKVIKNDYMAWTDNRIVFEKTPLTELAKIIKKHYGIDVKITEKVLGLKTITGIMPNDNLDVLLQSLNAMGEFKVMQTDNSIIITENN